ncbi:MAG: hypothetical protein PHP59_10185 [Methanofollis sp.]|uniref:hypothetical protein n=1 Tax=Methanofollis sp. TaxID=2052835 RepID=UPI00261CDB11|nr:hypothetical protein [Methanofollis sp.]MDD4255725.1 hypothetical protein [Methanofollis sp.]
MIAQALTTLIDGKIARLNTLDPAIVTGVDLDAWTVNVRLKHRRRGREITLSAVPVAPQRFGAGALWIAPAVGDIVLVAYSHYDLKKQLKNLDIVDVNEEIAFHLAHALVIAGLVPRTADVPAVPAGGILLQHQSGAGIEIDAAGNMILKAAHISHRGIQ